jgi:hypothetical protein
MENWSSNLREWWSLHGHNVKRYGLCLLLILAGIRSGMWLMAWIGLAAAFSMVAYDRYDGEGWRQRGASVLGQNKSGKPPSP